MVNIHALLYSFIASIIVGLHLFSIKLLSLYPKWTVPLIIFIVVTFGITRVLIYYAMKNVSNPAIVNVLLNCSVFVTFLASLYFLKLQTFNMWLFGLGLIFIVIGFTCINMSYVSV